MDDNKKSALQKEWEALRDVVLPQIQDKLVQARKLVDEAVKLSEDNAIPFAADVVAVREGWTYIPYSLSGYKSSHKFVPLVEKISNKWCEYYTIPECAQSWDEYDAGWITSSSKC